MSKSIFSQLFDYWNENTDYNLTASAVRDFIDWYVEHYSYADPYILANERDRFVDEFLKFKFKDGEKK